MTAALLGRRGFWLMPVAALAVTLMRIQVGAEVNRSTHLRVDEILSGSLLKRPISLALTLFVADLSTRTIEAWAIARRKGWVRR